MKKLLALVLVGAALGAGFAYVNDGSLEKLDDFVQAVLRELMR